MKILGMILGVVSVISAGVYLRKRLVLRACDLDKLISETEELKRGVLIYKKPIGVILSKLSLPPFKAGFKPEEYNEEGYNLVYELICLIKSSHESVRGEIFEDRIGKLKALRNEAEDELKTKGVMFIKIAVLLSLLFIVIII